MARLLIVDDEMDIREFAANFFKKRKIDVLTASSGEDALDIYAKQGADLILLDIKMDGIDGIETLKRMRQINNTAKIIMVTGRKPEEDATYESCKELGAIDYIHKPLQLHELERIVLKELLSEGLVSL
jgi:DNA-binding response OmpR family regulator